MNWRPAYLAIWSQSVAAGALTMGGIMSNIPGMWIAGAALMAGTFAWLAELGRQ